MGQKSIKAKTIIKMIVTLPKHYNKRYYNRAVFFGMLCIICCLSLKYCTSPNDFDVTKWSRAAFGPITSDTTKPVKQYFYIIKLSPQEWQSTMDTLQGVMGEFGVDMKVSDARNYQQLFYRQLGRLGSKVSLDSVMVKK